MEQALKQVTRKTLIAGNWKMNGSSSANATLLTEILAGMANGMFNANNNANTNASVPTVTQNLASDVLVCVPSVYLSQAQNLLKATTIKLGAQDVSAHQSGAYTGEVSAMMLTDFACDYVIVGHSERRAYHAESNDLVAQKTLRAIESGITPIVCVGETLDERESGKTSDVVIAQLQSVLSVLDDQALAKIVVAYEPVWAIGTGKTATPEMAQEVHLVLRTLVAKRHAEIANKMQILYGGSMKADNAKELLVMPDIDGGLIGGASLKAKDFLAIIQSVA